MKRRIVLISIIGLFLMMLPLIAGAEFVASGTCGDTLTWSIDNTGTLTISGTGMMPDFNDNSTNSAPWKKNTSSIINLVINNGVTSIGDDAFYGCSALTNVTIANSVISINNRAFQNCYNLENITLPIGLLSIGENAFQNCYNLENITLPIGLLSIGENAFNDCKKIESITVPDTVTSIGKYAFYLCENLTDITIPDNITVIGERTFGYCYKLSEFVFPSSLVSIGESAFVNCYALSTVTIPDSVTTIGDSVFSGCTSLISVNLSNSITSIGYGTFWGATKLTNITIPENVTSIGGRAFYYCSSLTNIVIPDKVDSIGYDAFSNCSELTSIIIPDSVISIGSNAFQNCTNLVSITIPGSVTSIGAGALHGCSNLSNLVYNNQSFNLDNLSFGSMGGASYILGGNKLFIYGSGNIDDYYSNSSCAWQTAGITEVVIFNGVKRIGNYTFNNCSNLTSISIPNSITTIGNHAFNYCGSLVNVSIPSSVNEIGDYAFYYCTGLSEIIIPEGITKINYSVFSNCSNLSNVTIPQSVTEIGAYAFFECNHLKSIEIPANVSNIGQDSFHRCYDLSYLIIRSNNLNIDEYAFNDCNIADIYYSGSKEQWSTAITIDTHGNSNFLDAELHFNYDHNHILISHVMVAATCTETGMEAYWECEVCGKFFSDAESQNEILTPIETPALGHIEVIDEAVAPTQTQTGLTEGKHCERCGEILVEQEVIPVDPEAEIVDNGTWGDLAWILDNEGLLTINGTGVMNSLGWNTTNAWLEYRSDIKTIHIDDGITRISDWAFSKCKNLTSIDVPQSVTAIGDYAFYYCSALNTISIPDSVISIGNVAFASCSSLTKIIIPDCVTSIGTEVFSNCSSLTDIHIPASVASYISTTQAFYGCYSLTNIIIPDGVESIGVSAFSACNNLVSITIPESVKSIGDGAFRNCYNLTSITIPDSVTSIGQGAFYSCAKLTSITIPYGVTSIGYSTFHECHSLNDINIPSSVSSIGRQAFYACENLKKIVIPDSVHTFGDRIFSHSLTIYCYEYSDADSWATEKGINVIYLDNINLDSIRSVVLPDDFRVVNGETIRLTSFVSPLVDDPSLIWSSSNPSVISVENGTITTNAIGTATITLTVGTVSDSVDITSYQIADSFQISPSEIWIVAKDEMQLSIVNIEPEGAEANIVWNSSDSSYASVNSEGFVTTKKPGDIIISADSENSIHRECVFHICYPVTAIELESASYEMIPDTDLQLTAHVTMRTQSCENHLVTFTSSDPEIATVDENGLVHAIKHGIITITVESASGITASKTITVIDFCDFENGEIIDHLWGAVEYIWSEDNTTITATRVCQRHEEHIQTETVAVSSQETKSATCTESGETTYTSDEFANEAFEVQSKTVSDIVALGHTLTAHDKVDATCTATGTEAYWECETCGDLFSDEEAKNKIDAPVVIPAKGHALTAHAKVDSTCTATGTEAYWECEVCGDLFSDAEAKNKIDAPSVIAAKGHTLTAHAKVDATCTETGTEAYWECDVCEKLFSDEEAKNEIEASVVIAAKGHDWNRATYEWAADNSFVTASRTCKNDESHTEAETVRVTSTIISPTGNTGGSVIYTSDEFSKEGFTVQTKNLEIPALKDMSVINLPSMLTSIEDEAFENLACEAIIVPNSCNSIGNYAFRSCKNLKYIRVPVGVDIPSNAFEGCENVVIDRNAE